jgi:biopolymer transport protein ExbB/TolQ
MSTVVRFFQDGGAFMIPILLVFGFGIAISIERWTYLTMSGASNRALWKKIVPFLKAGNFQEAATHTAKSKAAIGSILTYGLYRVKSARRRDDIEKAMEESLMEVLPRLEKRTHYIATLANIATLLGLLGTIIGLIAAFTAVAEANPAEKADMLSASISTAMNTTAFGLMAAIPLLLIHAYLQTKTNALVDSLEMASVKFLNAVTERQLKLNITAFMNLMVILVPFLLITAVFSRLAILELNLPGSSSEPVEPQDQTFQLEIIVRQDKIEVGDRNQGLLGIYPNGEDGYDYIALADKLLELKERYPTKTDASILLEQDIAYDTLVQVMDTVRVAQEVDEDKGVIDRSDLFPNISIGDAPVLDGGAS